MTTITELTEITLQIGKAAKRVLLRDHLSTHENETGKDCSGSQNPHMDFDSLQGKARVHSQDYTCSVFGVLASKDRAEFPFNTIIAFK